MGLCDAIGQVRACVQSTQDCLQNCRRWQFTDESLGPMKLNDSRVKCTSLQFVVNTNHMKVASDSIGPCDCHVT